MTGPAYNFDLNLVQSIVEPIVCQRYEFIYLGPGEPNGSGMMRVGVPKKFPSLYKLWNVNTG